VARHRPAAAKGDRGARARQIDCSRQENPAQTKPSLNSGLTPRSSSPPPTDLIVTEGQPNYVPITGTSLLFVKNTTANVFKLLTDGMSYVLIGGRWFARSRPTGREFVAPVNLPRTSQARRQPQENGLPPARARRRKH
jgi:hypothetical protein